MVHPGVFEAGIGDQHQVFVADRFDGIAYDSLCAFGVFDKIDFTFGMDVNRKVKSGFKAFHYDKTIFIR